jgi:hypothetical protein
LFSGFNKSLPHKTAIDLHRSLSKHKPVKQEDSSYEMLLQTGGNKSSSIPRAPSNCRIPQPEFDEGNLPGMSLT